MTFICDELQQLAERVFRGEPRAYDLIINISPGTSKSTICSILFPCWIWARFPQARILTASHTDMLCLDLATKSRDVIRGEKYRRYFPEVILSPTQDAKGYYRNTLGGDRLTCTVAGKSPMGFHGHFLLIDDPIDPKKAVSEAELKSAKDFISNILPTRKVDKQVSVTCLIMQRLHRQDPTAVMMEDAKKEGAVPVKRICLPAELPKLPEGTYSQANVDPVELTGKYTDGLMDPNRLPRAVLRDYKARLGAYGYASQFEQNPVPLEGGMFKEHWFNQRRKAAPYHARRIRYWDRACLVGETLVETSRGAVPIKDVCVGDLVLTRAGYRKVVWSGMTKIVDQITVVRFVNGSTLCGTHDHRVWTEDNGWVPLGELNCSNRVLCLGTDERCLNGVGQNGMLKPKSLFSMEFPTDDIREIAILRQCDGVPIERNTTPIPCTALCGGRIMETFPKDTMSTIRMEIGITTTCPIWNVYHEQNIIENMGHLPGGIELKQERNTRTSWWQHLSGQWPLDQKNSLPVFFVEGSSCPDTSIPSGLSFVDQLAPAVIDVGQLQSSVFVVDQNFMEHQPHCVVQNNVENSIGRQTVLPVGRDSKSSNANKSVARQCVVQSDGVPVFDLEVDGEHEFFANGILVHNSTDQGGCYTAGVLLAKDPEGNYYVEHVVHGQWEPNERNQRIKATALRDRARYGPKNEPTVYVEMEGGSSGIDSFREICRLLAGFRVLSDRPTGNKDTRAEPWASQLAAGNVYLVDDGTWDVANYVEEHTLFKPEVGTGIKRGRFKDQVDASSGAFNLLAGPAMTSQKLVQILPFGKKKDGLRFVVCDEVSLPSFVVAEQNSLLVSLQDPFEGEKQPPGHALNKCQGVVVLEFADYQPSELQERWEEKVEPYDKLPAEIVMNAQHGKKLWAFLLRKREAPPEIIVVVDRGDRRAISVVYGLCDVMGFPRTHVYNLLDPDNVKQEGKAPNLHVYDTVRASRGLVI